MQNDIGKKIREFRVQNGDTLSDLANYLSIDVGNLSKIETGKRSLPFEIINKLADRYKLNLNQRAYLLAINSHSNEGKGVYKNVNQEENKQAQGQQINVPNNLPVLFSDSIGVTSSPFGLVFDFGQRVGPTNQVNIVARVGLSKEHGEALLKVLSEKIKEMQLLTKKGDRKND